jgi:RNA polymerase sigma-70 factor (ECF subfamily)
MNLETERMSQLMEEYATGDERAFDALYLALAPRLYGFCRRLAVRESEADDLFQETVLKLHRARATYIAGANVLHWAFAIARSTFITRLRYRRRRPERLGVAEDVAQQTEILPLDHATPESEVLAEDMLGVAVDELRRMSDKNRLAYILIKDEGLSIKEAAAILGTTPTVVKKRAQRAYQQLRAALDVGEGTSDHTHLGSEYGTRPS